MKIIYIGHSGFAVETGKSVYIFDYFKGELPDIPADKSVIVFASHSHPDHYNPQVFDRLKEEGVELSRVQAVLGKDIRENKYPEGVPVIKARAHMNFSLEDGTVVETLLSTDQGVAFLLITPEGVIYHAGDLNDWYWEGEPDQDNRSMTGRYRAEIDRIRGKEVDIAFVPLDPRQEKDYARGMLYFLKQVPAKHVFPMHYWDKPQIMETFLREYPAYEARIENPEHYRAGRQIGMINSK